MSLDPHEEPAAIQTHIGAIFISLELSRSKWLITSLVPGGGQRMSKRWVEAGDLAGLLARFWAIRDKVSARTGIAYPIVVIQEAGLDGFWIHRALVEEGIESHVVDAASIAVSRRRRRAKTDKIDGEGLLRALLAFKRGEPRVCSMVRVPTPQDEDRRRICRERKTLIAERIRHVNRIKGLLFSQGIGDYEPLRRDRRRALEAVRTGDGRALDANMKAQIGRELDRLELLLGQIAAVEAERDAMLARPAEAETAQSAQDAPAPVRKPMAPGAQTVAEAEAAQSAQDAPAPAPVQKPMAPGAQQTVAEAETAQSAQDAPAPAPALVQKPMAPGAPTVAEAEAAPGVKSARSAPARVQKLMELNGLGAETVAMLETEAFYRSFDNRRQLAAFVGLAGTPWKSGAIDHEQGVSMGNQRLRQTMIQLAWFWPQHQPNSALTRWYRERIKGASKIQKKKMVVALARKLLVALWRYVDAGVVIEGAVLKRAARAR
jgi:transposase